MNLKAQLKMIKFDIVRTSMYIVLLTYLLVVNTSHVVMGTPFIKFLGVATASSEVVSG
jgi:hypothetical protein